MDIAQAFLFSKVGSQGDGSAQLVCKSAADQAGPVPASIVLPREGNLREEVGKLFPLTILQAVSFQHWMSLDMR